MEQLPEDPEEAFVDLVDIVRERYGVAWDELPNDGDAIPLWHRYMSDVLPAAKHYGIERLADWEPPHTGDYNHMANSYRRFMREVDYCVTELRLRVVGRVKRKSVALDAATKVKLRHLLDQIWQTVDNLEVPAPTKDRLYSRLNALQEDLERERTRFEAFGELMMVACELAGEGTNKAFEPLVRLIERVGAAIGLAKKSEDAQLPPRREPKQITRKPSDDEIPF